MRGKGRRGFDNRRGEFVYDLFGAWDLMKEVILPFLIQGIKGLRCFISFILTTSIRLSSFPQPTNKTMQNPGRGDASNPIIIDESSSGPLDTSSSSVSQSNDARARKRKIGEEMSPPVGYRAIQPRREGQEQRVVPSVLAPRLGEVRGGPTFVERQAYVYTPIPGSTVHPAPKILLQPAPVPAPVVPPQIDPTHSLRPPRTQRAIFHPKPGFPNPPPGHPDPATPSLEFLPSTAPRPLLPIWTSIPTSDPDYQARLAENEARPSLPDGCVPAVWASKRRGLTSALEYYGRPIRTTGGTVHVGEGDIARAVMLEGSLGEGYGFWGTGKSVGTFVVPFGNIRKRGRVDAGEEERAVLVDERSGARPLDGVPCARVPTPPPDIQENISKILHQTTGSAARANPTNKQPELPEIDALLRAHRARTPIVVGISEDTTLVPFQLPRPFIVLGFFWITDAWPEPTGEAWGDLEIPLAQLERPEVGVRWRFRFDWCTSGQAGYPWWESPRAGVTPLFMSMREPVEEEGWAVDGPEADMTQTVRRQRGEATQDGWLPCDACFHESAEVYIEKRYCLHVGCKVWFYDRATRPPTTPRGETSPRRIILRSPRRCRRYGPDELGMTLRPALPQEPANPSPADAGKTFWKGWVCPECGCANERKGWKGWDCEGCTNKWYPDRKIWSADELVTTTRRRDPNLNTMPSLHPDIARFAGEVTMSSTIWRDGTKACFYGLRNKNEMHLLMATPTASSVAKTDEIFQLLQVKDNVNFRRTPDQQPGTRCESPSPPGFEADGAQYRKNVIPRCTHS